MRSIDVGCMQVNLLHHPQAFATLEQAFDPPTNARYAARFLISLFHQTADWPKAGALYHSATPEIAADYARRLEPSGRASSGRARRTRRVSQPLQKGVERVFGVPKYRESTAAFRVASPGDFPERAI